MDREIWQQLLSLESRDLTQQWFNQIHGRQLNTRRSKEINSASRQAREYFRNAENSNYSVRPLLTYYGVASLSRALLLLLRREGGEEGLTSGHGLRTVAWEGVLSGDRSTALRSLTDLTIRTCNGLFCDFITETENIIALHVNSSGIDWSIKYDFTGTGDEIQLVDVLERLPDIKQEYASDQLSTKCALVNEITFKQEDGLYARVRRDEFENFREEYVDRGYGVEYDGDWCEITCTTDSFHDNTPLFINQFLDKQFGSIPPLYMSSQFSCGSNFSQLGIIYIASYFLGMLVRYYPTHWMSLIQGSSGDELWPAINKTQNLIQISYPEIVIELIHHMLDRAEEN